MRLALAALVLSLAVPVGAQQVFVIDATGAGDFTTLPAAFTAAPAGSILLLRSTSFVQGSTSLQQKAMTIVGDSLAGPPPLLIWSLGITGVPAGSTLVLRNVMVGLTAPPGVGGLRCESNAGAIFLEECLLVGGTTSSSGLTIDAPCFGSGPGGPGLSVKSSDVTAVRCSAIGGRGGDKDFNCPAFPGGEGVLLGDGGRLAAWDGSSIGGEGGNAGVSASQSMQGGAGFHLQTAASGTSAWGLLAGGEVIGGEGGVPNGDGGVGLHSAGSITDLYRLDVSIAGGPGTGLGQNGAAQTELTLPAPLPGTRRSMRVDSPLREQQGGQLTLHGVAGEVVFCFASKVGDFVPKLGKGGAFALDAPLGPIGLPPITDPSGDLVLPFIAPDLPLPGDEGNVWLLQPFFLGPSGARLGSPTALVLLDASI